jgi:uncharacterized protein
MQQGALRPIIAILLLLLLLGPPETGAAMDRAKYEDLKSLLQAMDSLKRVRQTIDLVLPQILAKLKEGKPNIPDTVWDQLSREAEEQFRAASSEFEEPLIVIYDDNFTAAEVKELLAFYVSPIGRKWVAQLPKITEQSFALGKTWGERVTRRIVETIRQNAKQKGYEL